MSMTAQTGKGSFVGKQVFVGIDVHKESWHVMCEGTCVKGRC